MEYFIDAPWEIVKTHVYIGNVAPDKSAPGRFPYEAGEIEFTPSGGSVYIAAHAEIRIDTGQVDEFDNRIYVYESVWAQTGTDFAIGKGANWATYFEYEIPEYPQERPETNTIKSVYIKRRIPDCLSQDLTTYHIPRKNR